MCIKKWIYVRFRIAVECVEHCLRMKVNVWSIAKELRRLTPSILFSLISFLTRKKFICKKFIICNTFARLNSISVLSRRASLWPRRKKKRWRHWPYSILKLWRSIALLQNVSRYCYIQKLCVLGAYYLAAIGFCAHPGPVSNLFSSERKNAAVTYPFSMVFIYSAMEYNLFVYAFTSWSECSALAGNIKKWWWSWS